MENWFQPCPSKQTQKFIFTCKAKKIADLPIFFNDKPIQEEQPQNQLGLILDTSGDHIRAIISKAI